MEFKKLLGATFLASVLASLGMASMAWGVVAQQVAEKAFPSVVLLVLEDARGQPVSVGSGFFVSPGVVATNLDVIEGASGGHARIVGQQSKYEINGAVGIDSNTKLALLSIKGAEAPGLPLGDSRQVKAGDQIFALGNPLHLEGTFSEGIVGGVRIIGSDTIFQISAPISPACNGGPLLDTQGQVVGVTLATFQESQSLDFAIPSHYLESLLSNMTLVNRLSSITRSARSKSAFDSLGQRRVEGLVGRQFAWAYGANYGAYTFSLYNQMREYVYNVICLVVFLDEENYPIAFDRVEYEKGIPPRCAKRLGGKVDSMIQEIVGVTNLSRQVRFRMLAFQTHEGPTSTLE